MKIAYLGPKGTFSEEAAVRYFSSGKVEAVMYDSIIDVLEAVEEGSVQKGIVPIENAIEGTITMTADGLLNYNVWIEGEAVLPVSMHLLAAEGTKESDIKEVWSIPPALAQCRRYIRNLGAESRHYSSTAAAAKALSGANRRDAGAIASEWAAQTFGLSIIKRNIEDYEGNCTRFFVLTKDRSNAAEAEKTMLLVTPGEDRPGLLAVILNVFSSLDINLSWIESRPTKRKLGTYRFFIEAETAYGHPSMKKAEAILETYGHQVKNLGSYRVKRLGEAE